MGRTTRVGSKHGASLGSQMQVLGLGDVCSGHAQSRHQHTRLRFMASAQWSRVQHTCHHQLSMRPIMDAMLGDPRAASIDALSGHGLLP